MYVYDVWVNYVDGMQKSYNIPEYHEWNKHKDQVELLVEVPVVLISSEALDQVENGFDKLPAKLLSEVEGAASRSKNNRIEKIPYAMILTNGDRALVVDTDGEDVPNYKSRLIPRQETMVRDMVEGRQPKDYGWEFPADAEDLSAAGRVINLDHVHMYGLTRREREMKEILTENLFRLLCSENIEEVRYWYTDLFTDKAAGNLAIEEMVEEMSIPLKKGWGTLQEEFGTKIAKYLDTYEGIWEVLERADKDKVGG